MAVHCFRAMHGMKWTYTAPNGKRSERRRAMSWRLGSRKIGPFTSHARCVCTVQSDTGDRLNGCKRKVVDKMQSLFPSQDTPNTSPWVLLRQAPIQRECMTQRLRSNCVKQLHVMNVNLDITHHPFHKNVEYPVRSKW